MGYLREPDDVDFIVNSTPLTKEELKMISAIAKKNREKYDVITLEDVLSGKPLPLAAKSGTVRKTPKATQAATQKGSFQAARPAARKASKK